tara:strand:- start:349 stop:879 length:531 start_codon:yes stop_codon:yes gene_type:complete
MVKNNAPHFNEGMNNEERKEARQKRMEIFLSAYEEWGTIKKACEITNVSRDAYLRWHSEDFDFVRRFDTMKQSFAESLETIALDRVKNPDKGKGSDILLLGLLNANMPAKYRPQLAVNEDSAKELIIEWRKASKEIAKELPPLENGGELAPNVKKTLSEILEKRGKAPKEGDNSGE